MDIVRFTCDIIYYQVVMTATSTPYTHILTIYSICRLGCVVTISNNYPPIGLLIMSVSIHSSLFLRPKKTRKDKRKTKGLLAVISLIHVRTSRWPFSIPPTFCSFLWEDQQKTKAIAFCFRFTCAILLRVRLGLACSAFSSDVKSIVAATAFIDRLSTYLPDRTFSRYRKE